MVRKRNVAQILERHLAWKSLVKTQPFSQDILTLTTLSFSMDCIRVERCEPEAFSDGSVGFDGA